jgi:hypothetical protein
VIHTFTENPDFEWLPQHRLVSRTLARAEHTLEGQVRRMV